MLESRDFLKRFGEFVLKPITTLAGKISDLISHKLNSTTWLSKASKYNIMAKLNTNESFSGLVGTVIMSSWKGIPYVKHKGRISNKPRSNKQLSHAKKWGVMSKFINSMNELLDRTFNNFAVGRTGANAAFSYNFKNIITGDYPFYTIDYSRALVSRGDLPNVMNPAIEATGNGQLQVRWTNNAGTGQAAASDTILIVLHCPVSNITLHAGGFEKRKEEIAIINARQFLGETVECWVVCMSADEKEVADSVYLGSLVIL